MPCSSALRVDENLSCSFPFTSIFHYTTVSPRILCGICSSPSFSPVAFRSSSDTVLLPSAEHTQLCVDAVLPESPPFLPGPMGPTFYPVACRTSCGGALPQKKSTDAGRYLVPPLQRDKELVTGREAVLHFFSFSTPLFVLPFLLKG